MKKVLSRIKQNIFGFIIGTLLFCGIGVYATTILASQVTYTNNDQENVQDAIDDLYNKVDKYNFANNIECDSGKTCIASQLHIGDYISMTPTLTKYTILSSDTGYNTDQTINPSELNIWRIISINSDGTADAVSEYVSSKNAYFQGKEGYKNYIGTLNKIASAYTNPSYVIRTRHMGYGAATQYITNTTKLEQTTAPWTVNTSSPTTLTDEVLGGGDKGYEQDYNLVKNILGSTVANKAETTTATAYWMASRYYSYSSSTDWSFNVRYVSTSGNTGDYHRMYRYEDSSFSPLSYTKAVRPIVTLKSGITISGGDGKSKSTAWIFN